MTKRATGVCGPDVPLKHKTGASPNSRSIQSENRGGKKWKEKGGVGGGPDWNTGT